MFLLYQKIRRIIINIFYRQLQYPSVVGNEIKRARSVGRPKLVYADEFFKLERELSGLRDPEQKSAERYASNKGDLYLYSYVAPARYGVRAWYAAIISFISFFWYLLIFPLSIIKNILSEIWTFLDNLIGATFNLVGTLLQFFFKLMMYAAGVGVVLYIAYEIVKYFLK